MNKFFSADHHFGHANIIKFCKRPFDSAYEMNEMMIRYWNETVKHDDEVYYLGDFTLYGLQYAENTIRRLNGKIFFLEGGHDRRWFKKFPWHIALHDRLPPLHTINLGRDVSPPAIVLCHYPLLTWEKSHYGSLHLHGHSHGNVGKTGESVEAEGLKTGFRVDVGVDNWDFRPVALEDLI